MFLILLFTGIVIYCYYSIHPLFLVLYFYTTHFFFILLFLYFPFFLLFSCPRCSSRHTTYIFIHFPFYKPLLLSKWSYSFILRNNYNTDCFLVNLLSFYTEGFYLSYVHIKCLMISYSVVVCDCINCPISTIIFPFLYPSFSLNILSSLQLQTCYFLFPITLFIISTYMVCFLYFLRFLFPC